MTGDAANSTPSSPEGDYALGRVIPKLAKRPRERQITYNGWTMTTTTSDNSTCVVDDFGHIF
jgi:hypothetical protein